MEKITKPAKTLVPQLMKDTISESLKIKNYESENVENTDLLICDQKISFRDMPTEYTRQHSSTFII